MKRALPFLLILSMFPLSPLASADNASDAKDLFTKGRELRAKNDCKGAIPLFRKASQLLPTGLGSLRNLAECEEQVSMWASARRDWLDLKRSVLTANDPKYEGWEADADAAAARLSPKVGKLTIEVMNKKSNGDEVAITEAESTKVKVLVNGEPLDPRLVGTELDRDPGSYLVRVEAEGAQVEESATIGEGQSKKVHLAIALPELTTVDVSSETVATKDVIDHGKTARTLGWTSVAFGGAMLVGAGISALVRAKALSNVESKCPSYTTTACSNDVSADASHGRTASLLVNVFGGVGVVAIGVGVIMVLANPPPSSTDATSKPVVDKNESKGASLQWSPLIGRDVAGAALWGAF